MLNFGVGEGGDAIRTIASACWGCRQAPTARRGGRPRQGPWLEGLVLADQNVFLNDLLRLPQPVDLRLLYDAMDNSVRGRGRRQVMAELVRRASTRQPLMLVVEDLHWAEGITLSASPSLRRPSRNARRCWS